MYIDIEILLQMIFSLLALILGTAAGYKILYRAYCKRVRNIIVLKLRYPVLLNHVIHNIGIRGAWLNNLTEEEAADGFIAEVKYRQRVTDNVIV